MMTREEKAKAIRAGQKVAWANGKRWGFPFKGDLAERERIAQAVANGEMTMREGARALQIASTSLLMWMKRHGYAPKHTKTPIEPTERDIKALREYWHRDCSLVDVCEFSHHSYAVVKRWVDKGYGKD